MSCQQCNNDNSGVVDSFPECSSYSGSGPKYAGFWRRLVAGILDTVVVAILRGTILAGAEGGVFFPALYSAINSFIVGIFLLFRWLYFAVMERSSYQATFGKRLVGIKVTDMAGGRITFLRATLRHFAKTLSRMIFYIGYFMISLTEKKQGLHDMIAGCLVVDAYE